MYTPTKGRYKRFKRVISNNSTPEPPDDDEVPEWNGFSSDPESLNDMAIDSPASLDGHQTEDRGFRPESSPLESSQPFVDALEYQPDDDEMGNTLSEPQELASIDLSAHSGRKSFVRVHVNGLRATPVRHRFRMRYRIRIRRHIRMRHHIRMPCKSMIWVCLLGS